MDNATLEVRLEHWTQIVKSCVNSGLTKKEWCARNEIPIKTYFYWQRRVRQNALAVQSPTADSTALTEIEMPAEPESSKAAIRELTLFHPDVVIRNRTLTIEISNTASKQLLASVGQVIRYVG